MPQIKNKQTIKHTFPMPQLKTQHSQTGKKKKKTQMWARPTGMSQWRAQRPGSRGVRGQLSCPPFLKKDI